MPLLGAILLRWQKHLTKKRVEHDMTAQRSSERDRTEHNRTEQNTSKHDMTGRKRTDQIRSEQISESHLGGLHGLQVHHVGAATALPIAHDAAGMHVHRP
jgi:predicted DNA repair protein MutK